MTSAVPVRKRGLRQMTEAEIAALNTDLAEPIEYRKSGLSLNHVVGCPIDCSYCIRHLYGNFAMKTPKLLMTDEEAVAHLLQHRYFRADRTPLQVFNKATDPMLPVVFPHTMNTLRLLDGHGLTNHVLVITRWRVTEEMCAQLNELRHLRVTVLVTHSNIAHAGIEPVDSNIAATSLKTPREHPHLPGHHGRSVVAPPTEEASPDDH